MASQWLECPCFSSQKTTCKFYNSLSAPAKPAIDTKLYLFLVCKERSQEENSKVNRKKRMGWMSGDKTIECQEDKLME